MPAPPALPEQVEQAIAEGRVEDATAALCSWLRGASPRHVDEALVMHAEACQLRDAERREEIEPLQAAQARRRLARRVLDLRRLVLQGPAQGLPPVPSQAAATPTPAPIPATISTIFVSYNHADAAAARGVCAALTAAGFKPVIDEVDMQPGADIAAFARGAVARTQATVCLVSRASLLSAWVAQETLLALAVMAAPQAAPASQGRRFVALALDGDFRDPALHTAFTIDITQRLAHLQRLRMQRDASGADTLDLDPEIARLHALRNGSSAVLQHLRASLCLDFRLDARAATLARLVRSLQAA